MFIVSLEHPKKVKSNCNEIKETLCRYWGAKISWYIINDFMILHSLPINRQRKVQGIFIPMGWSPYLK